MADRKRHLPPQLVAGLVLFAGLGVIAVVAPLVLARSADTMGVPAAPSPQHWFGTDVLGRDVLARSLIATRSTLLMSLSSTAIAVVIGVAIGSSIWLAPGWVREPALRLIDSTVAFPSLILALVVAAVLGAGLVPAVIAIGLAGIPGFARLTSNMTASVAQRDFVTTARLLGVPPLPLLGRHLLPNISGALLVLIAGSFSLALLEISSLSFVGLGVQSPNYDWGRLLADAIPQIYRFPMQSFAPSLMLIITGVAAVLTGDGLAHFLDPHSSAIARRLPAVRATAGRPERPEARVEVRGLQVTTATGVTLVKGIDFHIGAGEVLGLVGESGSGKSLTAMALARLSPEGVSVSAELLRLDDMDLLGKTSRSRLAREIGLVYQDPGTTFNPALRMKSQLTEVARVHLGMPRRRAKESSLAALTSMRIRDPESLLERHPFQLSGGMLQRSIIASSLMTDPKLIIADEPTTALDVTVQAEVLRQLKQVNREHGTSVLFISHDLGVVQAVCDRVLVMRAGELVEELTPAQLESGQVDHPYTRSLLAATPRLELEPEPEPDCDRQAAHV